MHEEWGQDLEQVDISGSYINDWFSVKFHIEREDSPDMRASTGASNVDDRGCDE